MAWKAGKLVWTGRILTVLSSLLFLMSATMKFIGGDEVKTGMAKFGIPESLILPLGVLELSCVAFYLLPPTSILGAILLTGYIGGAICTHLRVGDPIYVHIVLGVVVWLGVYLREDRLRLLIPVRR